MPYWQGVINKNHRIKNGAIRLSKEPVSSVIMIATPYAPVNNKAPKFSLTEEDVWETKGQSKPGETSEEFERVLFGIPELE